MARWNWSATMPGGHRLYVSAQTSSVAIADDENKPGQYLLDQTRELSIGEDGALIPVLDMVGDTAGAVAPAGAVDLMWLSDRYSWAVSTPDGTYRSVRVAS